MPSRAAKQKRKHARKRWGDILRKYGSICFHCKEQVKPLPNLDQDLIEQIVSSHRIAIMKDGSTILLATIDHLKPLREGGTNSLKNIVPSCYPCNRRRELLALMEM